MYIVLWFKEIKHTLFWQYYQCCTFSLNSCSIVLLLLYYLFSLGKCCFHWFYDWCRLTLSSELRRTLSIVLLWHSHNDLPCAGVSKTFESLSLSLSDMSGFFLTIIQWNSEQSYSIFKNEWFIRHVHTLHMYIICRPSVCCFECILCVQTQHI